MLFERFEEKGLSHYSYAVGCKEKGQIAIIDPRRDVEIYLEYAEKNRCVISHVFETHIHGDYASGARELAYRARAPLFLSAYDKGETYEVSFPHKKCRDEDIFRIGSLLLKVLHTPGHTPEHIAFLLYTKEGPKALFSGDFLLVGSMGRPDLFGKNAATSLARQLFNSVQEQLKGLPDNLKIFPAHGMGSFSGAGISGTPSSTLGIERRSNPFLKHGLSEEDFVSKILNHEIPAPPYFSRMKIYNSSDDRFKVPALRALDTESFKQLLDRGATVIDLRDQKTFAKGHIPGSICIGIGPKVGFWASWVVSYDQPILLVTDNPTHSGEVIHSLARVGLEQVAGYLKGGFESWNRSGHPVNKIDEVPLDEIDSLSLIIDVRAEEEWEIGHLPEAIHIPCSDLPQKLRTLPDKKLVFICAGGYRSIFAASLARRAGHALVGHVPDGMHTCRLDLMRL